MAEQDDKGTTNPIGVTAPRKGLFTDSAKEQQPQGTYPFALNAVDESSEGDMFALSNENSNFSCADIPANYKLIGSVYMENSTSTLFFVDTATGNSIIATLNQNCKFEELVVSDCLGFSLSNQIEGTFRIKNGCDRIVYFTDYNNPDRFINLDSLGDFLKNGRTLEEVAVDKWECDLFNIDRLTPDLCIELADVISGGGRIPVGTIQFTARHLDSNLNGAGFSDPTLPIPITDDSYSLDYVKIDGAESDVYANKSVQISISNIDNDYSYIEIGVLITNGGITRSYIVDRVNITGTTVNYLFTGLDNDSIEETLSYTKNIYSSRSITQLENRLIRANLKTADRDYSSFQRLYANNITSFYVVNTEQAENANVAAVSPYYYDSRRGYMRDEVYAFGIYYEYPDGTKSPVFHIPGRTKDPAAFSGIGDYNNNASGIAYAGAGTHSRMFSRGLWDTTEYTVVDTGLGDTSNDIGESEVKHLGLTTGDTVKRWEVYNTAIRHNVKKVSFSFSTGEMAYYEGQTLYPTTEDCDGNKIYGDLAGTPIRHHKFPDSTLEPHYDGTNLYNLGIQFENVALPPGATGYKIVRADRDYFNKTVLDKGTAYYMRKYSLACEGDYYGQAPYMNKSALILANTFGAGDPAGDQGNSIIPYGPESSFSFSGSCGSTIFAGAYTNWLSFNSGLTKYIKPIINPSHIKTELIFEASMNDEMEGTNETGLRAKYTGITQLKFNATDSRTNISIANSAYVGSNTIEREEFSEKVLYNYNEGGIALELQDAALSRDENDLLLETEANLSPVASAGLYNSDFCGYYSLKSANRDVYNNLETIKYLPTSNCMFSVSSALVYGGDIFISRLDYKHTAVMFNPVNPADYCNANKDTYSGSIDNESYAFAHVVAFYGESEINTEFRHEIEGQKYYPKSFVMGGNLASEHLIPAVSVLGTGDGSGFIPNYYHYNTDFNKVNDEVIYIPLPATFNYCSNCLNTYPNRVTYSEQSFQEETADHYLTTLVNNYKDILSNKGDITKIYNYNNTLLIDTEYSRFVLPSSTQAIQSSEENIFVGTGEFFSFPVKEIVDANVGYMGNQSQWANDITEHGIFSVDAKSGNIFVYNKGLDLLSGPKYGMSNYFKEHLPLELPKQYEELREVDVTWIDNPANPYNGVGYTSVFDTRHNRWILTKHDYRLTQAGIDLVNAVSGVERLDYTEEGWKFINLGGSTLIKPKDNPDWFENTSWTMSFSLNRKAWISWHSYFPTNYIDDKLGFYSVDNNLEPSNIYRHNKKFEYQTFYGTYYPHIIEMVESSNPLITNLYNSISFVTKAKQWDDTNKYFVDKRLVTFDKAIIYNNYQNSGIINLLTKREQTSFDRDQESWHQQALLDVNERTYSFNEFRDLVGNYDVPMFTKDWNNTDYRSEYFIDKIINPTSINLNKNWWEQDIFRGKHLVLRLFFSILAGVKITTQFQLFEKGTTHR